MDASDQRAQFSEVALEILQVWKQKPQTISPFPLSDRHLLKNRRGFPAYILSVRKKKKKSWINVILGRIILPKIPLLVQFFIIFISLTDLADLCSTFLTVWSYVCDLTFLFLPFGVQSLSLLPSAFNSSVDSVLLTLIVILLSAFNIIPVRFPPCQSTDSVP